MLSAQFPTEPPFHYHVVPLKMLCLSIFSCSCLTQTKKLIMFLSLVVTCACPQLLFLTKVALSGPTLFTILENTNIQSKKKKKREREESTNMWLCFARILTTLLLFRKNKKLYYIVFTKSYCISLHENNLNIYLLICWELSITL